MYKLAKLYKLDDANTHEVNYFSFRKRMIAIIYCYVASFILILFAFINFYYKNNAIAWLDIVAAIISLYSLYLFKKKKQFSRVIHVSTFNIFFFFLLYLYLNKNQDFGLIWTIFLPLFIIPLNGHKKGLVISLVFYFFAGIIAYDGIGIWDGGNWNTHSFIRFIVASLVLVYIMYITELAIYRANLLLNIKAKREAAYIKKLQDRAEIDYLTKIANRRKISSILQKEILKARRYKVALSIAILDIDNFKHINDTYGHNIGDIVLKTFATTLASHIRESDYIGRWGGEEFIIIYTHTDEIEALIKTQKLCQQISSLKIPEIKEHITCSAGVSGYKDKETLQEFVHRADEALYQAKTNGKNQALLA